MTVTTGTFILNAASLIKPRPPAEPQDVPYWNDPVGWAENCLYWPTGKGLRPYQEDILNELVEFGRESARGPHGLGKTTIAAIAILWFAATREAAGVDWKIGTTASAWEQLTHYLWPEVHKWYARINWKAVGRPPWAEHRELLDWGIKLRHGLAFATASNKPTSMEGAHAEHLLFVFDESKSIPSATFDAIEGAFSTAGELGTEAFALSISTPGEPVGRFYEIQSRRAGTEDWHVRHVTLAEAIDAGAITEEWAEQRARQWGESSALYKNRVLGEFASGDTDGVIPLSWLEVANDHWRERYEAVAVKRDPRFGTAAVLADGEPVDAIGVDVAAGGEDLSVLAFRIGYDITETLRFPFTDDTMDLVDIVAAHQDAHPKPAVGRVMESGLAKAVVDAIGVGAGVFHRLRKLRRPAEAFVASEGTKLKDIGNEFGFQNKRALAWWNLREMLDPANGFDVAIPPDDLLTGDLVTPKYREVMGGRILVESKDDIRKRIGRSTNDGDAVVMVMLDRGAGSAFRTYMERRIAARENVAESEEEEVPEQLPRVTPLTKGEIKMLNDQARSKRRAGRPTRIPRHEHVYVLIGDERRCHICREKPAWADPDG